MLLTNDGRYLVAVRNLFGWPDDRKAVVFIHDLQTKREATFDLDQIFDKDDIDTKYTKRITPFCYWYGDSISIVNTSPIVVDESAKKVYVIGINQEDERNRPTIVVDLAEMTVTVERLNSWIAKYDEQVRINQMTELDLGSILPIAQDYMLFHIMGRHRTAKVEHNDFGMDNLLYRLEPGDSKTPARFLMMRFNEAAHGFELVRELTLRNPVAPSQWIVTDDDKYLITLDEIDKIGVTDNVVVIYRLETAENRAFALEDFCTAEDIKNIISIPGLRFWRNYHGPSVKIVGAPNCCERLAPVHYVPHVIVDVSKMEVRLGEPFRPNEKRLKTNESKGIRRPAVDH
jgi:hypothetical protein